MIHLSVLHLRKQLKLLLRKPLLHRLLRVAMMRLQKEDGRQRESIIPRIWRSTVKRPLSADSDADIRSIPDLDRSSHASPSKALRPSASPVIGLTKAPDSDTSPTSSPGKGIRDSDSRCLIKAHTGGDVSSECRDSMCEGAAVTSTFISLGDVLRGTPLTGAQSIAAQPEQRDGARAAAGTSRTLSITYRLVFTAASVLYCPVGSAEQQHINSMSPLQCNAYLLVNDIPMLQARAAHPPTWGNSYRQKCALQLRLLAAMLRQPDQAPGH